MRKPTRHDRIHNTPYYREYMAEQREIREREKQDRLERDARIRLNAIPLLRNLLDVFDD